MTHDPYFVFHQTTAQLRRVSARGGRSSARNRRFRLRTTAAARQMLPLSQPHVETTAAAIAALDAQFPWLRGVERRRASSAGPCPHTLISSVAAG